MTATLVSMTVPIVVLLIVGAVTLGLAYWAALVSEGKDEWLTGGSKPCCPHPCYCDEGTEDD